MRKIILTVMCLLCLTAVAYADSASAIRVEAPVLYAEYRDNGVAADAKYKGKTIEVTGTIARIKKDIADNIVIELKGPGMFETVNCTFGDKWAGKVATLKKGQSVVIRGTGDGYWVSVFVANCELVE